MGGDGLDDGAHEFLITRVVNVVVMGQVAGFFIITREVVLWMYGYRMTFGAAIIALVFAFGMYVVELGWGLGRC